MKAAAAITVEGVLRKPVGGTPIPEGIALYHSLCAIHSIILLADFAGDDELEQFLDTEELVSHSFILDPELSMRSDLTAARVFQASYLRNSGYGLAFVVEPDPEISAALYAAGFNVLHFMHAAYARPQWRPDYEGGQRPWDELVTQEQRAAKLRAADARSGSAEL